MDKTFAFDETQFAQVLSANDLIVPPFQREYRWGPDQIHDLWGDIKKAQSTNSNHFLGPIFLAEHKDPQNKKVDTKTAIIDGQQRLTTLMIFLRTMALAMHDLDPVEAGTIASIVSDPVSKEPKLSLSYGQKYFREIFVEHLSISDVHAFLRGTTFSNGDEVEHEKFNHLHEAFETSIKLSTDDLISFPTIADKKNRIQALFKTILHSLKFIVIKPVSDEYSPYWLFEGLNARGKDLETSEQVKNLVFALTSDNPVNLSEVQKLWGEALELFRPRFLDAVPSYDLEFYLLNFVQAAYDASATQEDLYSRIRALLDDDPDKAVEFVRGFKRAAEFLNGLFGLSPLKPGEEDVARSIHWLVHFRKDYIWLPLISAGNMQWQASTLETRHLVQLIEIFHARSLLLGIHSLQQWIDIMKSIATEIRNSSKNSSGAAQHKTCVNRVANLMIARLRQASRKKYPVSISGVGNLLRSEPVSLEFANYLLGKMEEVRSPGRFAITTRGKGHDIEHVYPKQPVTRGKAPVDHWPHMASAYHGRGKAEQEKILNRFGNLALFKEGDNRGVKNRPFADKNVFYRSSSFDFTKELDTFLDPAVGGEWTDQSIFDREKKLTQAICNGNIGDSNYLNALRIRQLR